MATGNCFRAQNIFPNYVEIILQLSYAILPQNDDFLMIVFVSCTWIEKLLGYISQVCGLMLLLWNHEETSSTLL